MKYQYFYLSLFKKLNFNLRNLKNIVLWEDSDQLK